MSRRLAFLLFAIVLLIGFGAWMTLRTDRAGGAEFADREQQVPQPVVDAQPHNSATSDPVDPAIGGGVRSGALPKSCVVVDSAGHAVESAHAAWYADLESWEADPTWPFRAWNEFVETAIQALSADDGRLTIGAPPGADSQGSHLVVSSSASGIRVLSFPAGEPPLLPARVELASHGAVRARVLDADSQPVVGVLVRSVYDVDRVGRRAMQGPERIAASYVCLEARTDVEGYAHIPALERDQLLWAEDGSRVSSVERARGGGDVELRLSPVLIVTGRVIADESEVSLVGAEVSAYALLGSGGDRVAMETLSPQGKFGPIRVPILSGVRYSFQAQGPGFIASSVDLDPATPGGPIDVEIHVRRGVAVPVRVVDETREPLAGAYVFFQWQVGSQWEKARGISDDAGMADMGRIPVGSAWLSAKASGYVESQAQYPIVADITPFIEVALNPAGSVTGKVIHAGEPVHNFEIYTWAGHASRNRVERFRDRADGTFVLDQAPIGEVSVFAVGDDLPRSNIKRVTIRAEGTEGPLIIELPEALATKGRVVDALTGEPIPNASVQAWTWVDGVNVEQFGSPVSTTSDGGFELKAFGVGLGSFEVRKDGYAPSMHIVSIEASGENDVGVVALSAGTSLEVRLILDGDNDPSRYLVQLTGSELHSARHFEAGGVIRFTGLSAGWWKIRVMAPDNSDYEETVQIGPRLVHRVDIAMPHASSFAFTIIDERVGVRTRPAVLSLVDAAPSARGREREVYAAIPESGRVELSGVQFDDAVASLIDENRAVLSYQRIPSLRAAPKPIRIEASEDMSAVRVVDRRGEPASDLQLILLQHSGAWAGSSRTDGAGLASFPTPPSETVDVLCDGGERGLHLHTGVVLGAGETRLVFDPNSEIQAHVADGTIPVSGCVVRAHIPSWESMIVAGANSTPDGEVVLSKISAGEYTVDVIHPALWPQQVTLTAASPSAVYTIDVRRRGSVVLTAKRSGLPVRDLAIDIRSEEFKTAAIEWIRQGLADSSSPTFTTGADGKLRLDGIPHGRYQWSAVGSDGSPVGGSFTVEPLTRVDVELAVP